MIIESTLTLTLTHTQESSTTMKTFSTNVRGLIKIKKYKLT